MKKVLLSLAVLMIGLSACSFALNSSKQATFTVAIASVFELNIDNSSILIDRLKPGEVKNDIPSGGVLVTAKTNNGKPWFVKISNDSPFSNGSTTIPNANFSWKGWTEGTGRWFGTGDEKITLTPALAYASSNVEGNNLPDGTKNHFIFKLAVPEKQAPGIYTTVVQFTMTE